jgi:uncharacterized protein YbjT (DUF2867 family)
MKAVLHGATGFIGSLLLDLLKQDESFNEITILSRKKLVLPDKFKVIPTDSDQSQLSDLDVAFCALGTTMAKAGSKEAFYHVDHDLIVDFASKAKEGGTKTFVLVSSVGAEASSSNFYLKVKGETEEDLRKIGFQSLIILRPSMLLGQRTEFRFAELIGKGAMTALNPLMLGGLNKYKGIQGKTVAKAMLRLGKENVDGTHILEWDKLQAFK